MHSLRHSAHRTKLHITVYQRRSIHQKTTEATKRRRNGWKCVSLQWKQTIFRWYSVRWAKTTCKQRRSEKNILAVARKNVNIMTIHQKTYNNVFKTFYLRNYKGNLKVRVSFILFESNNFNTANGGGYKHNKFYKTFNMTTILTAIENYLEMWSDFAAGVWKLVKYRAQWHYRVTMNVWTTEDS